MKRHRPHRKKTLPVPGDVFIHHNGSMRVINEMGYTVIESNGERGSQIFRELESYTPDCFKDSWMNVGFYYLGNALTDEWENG